MRQLPTITHLHLPAYRKHTTMEKKFTNRKQLSVSSVSSSTSTASSSSSLLSPGISPRKGLLAPGGYLVADSPPQSPALPSLIPRHGKPQQKTSLLWKLRRVVVIFGAVLVLTWLAMRTFLYPSGSSGYLNGEYEIVGADALPEEPSALMLNDNKGRKKWTVSIPARHDFPLQPSRYHEICQQASVLATSSTLRSTAADKWGTMSEILTL